MVCCPAELAKALVIQCDAGQISQIPHGWLWQGYPLLCVCLTQPPVPDCALRPRRVIFIMNWLPDPICRTGTELKVCVCVVRLSVGPGWENKGSADQGGSSWSKLALQPEPLNGWATADLQKGMNSSNCTWALCFENKVLQHGRNWKSKSLSFCIKYSNLLLCTFSTQPVIYKMHNIYSPAVKTNLLMFLKQLDMISCWMPWTQKEF